MSFSKLHGFENVSLNKFSSHYILKMTSATYCYIVITTISLFEVPLVRLKQPLIWYCARSSTTEVLCQWNVIDKLIVIWKQQSAANIVLISLALHTSRLNFFFTKFFLQFFGRKVKHFKVSTRSTNNTNNSFWASK